MDSYYANQATSLPHFSGHYRQRGSGFGALAAVIPRVALPLARRFILPTAKRIGKQLLKQNVPETMDVVGSKKSLKQALKSTISKTVKKQTGGSRKRTLQQRRQRSRSKTYSKKSTAVTKRENSISTRRPLKRSRSAFSQKLTMITNLLPTEATHGSVDL